MGRAGIAFATGFHPVDFILSPERFKERSKLTAEVVEAVRSYWRGEPVQGRTGTGEQVERAVFPRPVQRELPVWLTATRSTETFVLAGKMGVNLLTAVLRISREEMAEKIAAYRRARQEHGHDPDAGKVTLMLHAFTGADDDQVRQTVSQPFREYLKSHMEFLSTGASALAIRKGKSSLSGVQPVLRGRIAFWNPRVLPGYSGKVRWRSASTKLPASSTSELMWTQRWADSGILRDSPSSLTAGIAFLQTWERTRAWLLLNERHRRTYRFAPPEKRALLAARLARSERQLRRSRSNFHRRNEASLHRFRIPSGACGSWISSIPET